MAGLKDYLKEAAKDAISKVASEGIDAARNAIGDDSILSSLADKASDAAKRSVQKFSGDSGSTVDKKISRAGNHKMNKMDCPSCGATLEYSSGINEYVCDYCGTRIQLTGQTAAEAAANYAVKRLEYKDRREARKAEEQKENKKTVIKILIILLAICFAIVLFSEIITAINNRSMQKEYEQQKLEFEAREEEREALLAEIQEDIANGDYDSAYIKTNQLQGELSWSIENDEKWDGIRESLFALIEEKKGGTPGNDSQESETPSEPEPTAEPTPEPTVSPTPEPEPESVFYSTNTQETVKDGNAGVYSYKSRGGTYERYVIIDFDEGYVYRFSEGNDNPECERVRIVSGTLNDVLTITYRYDGIDYQDGIHFKDSRQPDHLIVQDYIGWEQDYYQTDLKEALSIRDSKTITDY